MKLELMPPTIDLVLWDTDGHSVSVAVVDNANAAVDLSTYAWRSTWRSTGSSGQGLVVPVDTGQAAAGIVTALFTPALMAKMSSLGEWDFQGTPPGMLPITIAAGTVTIERGVSR